MKKEDDEKTKIILTATKNEKEKFSKTAEEMGLNLSSFMRFAANEYIRKREIDKND